MENLEIAKFLLKLEKKAYAAAKKQKIEVSDKKAHDLVTNYDTFIEKFLIERLKKVFPDVSIVSEEFFNNNEITEKSFVIDPVDGTCNFANNLEMWGIQVAYVENNTILASAILLPYFGEFYAAKGQGAYRNNKRFYCEKRDLKHSFVCIDYHDTEMYYDMLQKILPLALQQRFFGVACFNYICVAQGKFGVLIIGDDANPWDYMPGKLIAEEAGCVTEIVNHRMITATSRESLQAVINAIEAE